MQSRSPWGIQVTLENNHRVSILGEIPGPTQIVDGTKAEVLLACQRSRSSKSNRADAYRTLIRSESEDGAGQNEKSEYYGGLQDRPRVRYIMGLGS